MVFFISHMSAWIENDLMQFFSFFGFFVIVRFRGYNYPIAKERERFSVN